MIYDSLKYIDNYKDLGQVYHALKFLAATDFSQHELGRFELNENCYYMVQAYDTVPKTVSEAHKKYIDIQLLVAGEEVIGVASIDCQKELVEEKPEKDCWLYRCDTIPVTLQPGQFMILYPNDLHMPGATLGAPVSCRKVVVKVKI